MQVSSASAGNGRATAAAPRPACANALLRPIRRRVAAIALVALTAGCGGSEESTASPDNPVVLAGAPDYKLPDLAELPEAQRPAFEDGTVDTAEYTEAFERFQQCANASSEQVIFNSRDPVSGYIEYGVNESEGGSMIDPTTPNGRCYQAEFEWIELAWQLSDPTLLEQGRQEEIDRYANETLPCLLKHGVEAPATYDGVVTPEFIALGEEWYRLYQAGKC